MNLQQHRYRAWLVPYAEETLDARRRAKLEAWLAHDPVLAAEAQAERRVVARLRAVAQSAEAMPGENDLWLGIQARLEPRRSSLRPLILVGGLSAAATSLAWAALWGPLRPPALSPPPAIIATGPSGANVIVIGPIPSQRHGHPNRRHRHDDEHLARRLTVPSNEVRHPEERINTTDDSQVAHGDAPSPAGGGAAETTPATGDTARFHLATSVRPIGHGDSEDAPTSPGAAPLIENPKASGPGDGTAQESSARSRAGGTNDAEMPAVTPPQLPVKHNTVSHHTRRQRRRHTRDTSRGEATGGESAGASDTAIVGGDAPPPKNTPKPID